MQAPALSPGPFASEIPSFNYVVVLMVLVLKNKGTSEGRSLSKFILFTDLDRLLLDGGTELFSLSASTALELFTMPGEQIIIASVSPSSPPGYVALGIVDAVSEGAEGRTQVRVASLRLFPETLAFTAPPAQTGIVELSDSDFDQIIARSLGEKEIDDAAASDNFIVAIYQFTNQLSRQQNGRCYFSDVPTDNGVAAIIRPLDLGGVLHISNFLFLDPEPGVLFERFAWTVGPQFEIIIDMHAMRPDIADTVNRTGLLALSDAVATWPDREALAWHRQQFFARLGSRVYL